MTTGLATKHWAKGKLQDLVFFQRGFDITKAQQTEGSVPVISSSGVTSYHSEAMATGPGVVIGRKGTLGSVHYSEIDYWPHDTTLWSKDLRGNNPRFVYFYLHTISFKRFDVGNSNPTLNRNHIHDLPVLIPPLDIQNRISELLSVYDDLIENNRRRMALLEDAARQLYREWFVRLRFPGQEHTPISKGVPVGWKRRTLGELVAIRKGKNITRETAEEGAVPVVAGGLEPAYFHNTANTRGPVVTISASGANAGHVNIYLEDIWASDCSVISTEWTPHTYYFYCQMKHRQQELLALQKGAAQPHVYPKDLERLEAIEAPSRLLQNFAEAVGPSFSLIANLSVQNQSLRAARDLLLPRLMNGEISVQESR